jgi:hypothetical protein
MVLSVGSTLWLYGAPDLAIAIVFHQPWARQGCLSSTRFREGKKQSIRGKKTSAIDWLKPHAGGEEQTI